MEVRGDWAWHKKLWRFYNTSWNAVQVCHLCPAKTRSNNPLELYWNYVDNCWQDNEFNLEQFIGERMPPTNMCFSIGISMFFFHVSIIYFLVPCNMCMRMS